MPLPPGIVSGVFTHADGTSVATYRAPIQSDGPVIVSDRNGDRTLAFMYHFFLFCWQANTFTVDILHGRLPIHRPGNIMVCRGVELRAQWTAETLRHFAVHWVSARHRDVRSG